MITPATPVENNASQWKGLKDRLVLWYINPC